MANSTRRNDSGRVRDAVAIHVQAGERGRRAGAIWAAESAEYLDLKHLASLAASGGFDDERAGYRVVCTVCGERQLSLAETAEFRGTFGLDDDDADQQPAEYWQGFVQGALDAFELLEI